MIGTEEPRICSHWVSLGFPVGWPGDPQNTWLVSKERAAVPCTQGVCRPLVLTTVLHGRPRLPSTQGKRGAPASGPLPASHRGQGPQGRAQDHVPARPRPRRTPPVRDTAPSSTAGPQTSLSPSLSSSLSPRLTHAYITLGTPARGGGACPTAGREGALDKHIFLLERDAHVSSRGTPACPLQQPRGPGGSELFQHCLAHGRCSVTCLLMRPRKCLRKDSTLACETSRAKGVWVLGVPYLPQSRASGVINPLPGQIPVLGGAELKPPRETPRHFTHTLPPTRSPKRGSMCVPRVISFPTRKLMPHLSRPPTLSQAHPWVLSCFRRVRLCDPEDCNPPGSFVCGILQARTLERVAISFSRGSSPPRDQTPVSCISCIGRRVLGSPCIHMHILFFLKFFSHLGCYTLLIRNAAHLFLVARTFTIQLLLVSERPF